MVKKEPGYIKIGSFREIPLLMHWSFPLGGLCVALFFHAKRSEVIFVCAAYAALIVLHELGHAIAARIFGAKVVSIELSGVGGICRAELPRSRLSAFVYVSAGLIVQFIVLAIAVGYILYDGWPTSPVASSSAFVFTVVNGLLIVMNLIPRKIRGKNHGTDGYIMWKLMLQLIRRHPYGYPDTSATISSKRSLLSIDGFMPPGFKVGIEIFNDNTTTMEFVVGVLTKHLKLHPDKAVEMMIAIHKNGGILVPLESYALAQKVATSISDEAKCEGFNLVCRPVENII